MHNIMSRYVMCEALLSCKSHAYIHANCVPIGNEMGKRTANRLKSRAKYWECNKNTIQERNIGNLACGLAPLHPQLHRQLYSIYTCREIKWSAHSDS
jgi:hypothetical protein